MLFQKYVCRVLFMSTLSKTNCSEKKSGGGGGGGERKRKKFIRKRQEMTAKYDKRNSNNVGGTVTKSMTVTSLKS